MIKAVIFDLDGTLYEPRFFPLRLILADPGNILKLAAERRCRRQLQGRCFGSGDEYYDELFLLMGKGNEERLSVAGNGSGAATFPIRCASYARISTSVPS